MHRHEQRHRLPYRGILLASVLLSAILLAVQFTILSTPASAETEETTVQGVGYKIEYPVSDGPINVAWVSPGRAWFTAPDRDMVGAIVRNSNADDELISVNINYIALDNGSQPYDIAYADNTVWFTEFGAGKLGRIDLSSSTIITEPTKEYPLPTAGSQPSGVAVAPDGTVWIVSANKAKLTRFDPVSESFTEYSYYNLLLPGKTISTDTTFPVVTVRDSNVIWFTVPGSDMILAYTVDRGIFSRLFLNSPNRKVREPAGIAVDSKGIPWVTSYRTNLVGRYAPGTLALWAWYEVPTPNSGPRGIVFQDNGTTWDIWFTEQNGGKLGRLTVTPKLEFVSLIELSQPPESQPWGITIGDDKAVWFTESGRRTVSELRPPYVAISRLPLVLFSQ